jgi:hypothetical protein
MTGPDLFCPRCEEAPDYCLCPHADIPGDFDPGPVPPGGDDGAAVLDQVHGTLTCYVMFPSAEAGWAVTLFAAATWAMPYLEFAARLVIKSPVKRCGKSRLFDVLGLLVRYPLMTSDISAAALVRSVPSAEDDRAVTVMLDEADTTFGRALKGDEKAG